MNAPESLIKWSAGGVERWKLVVQFHLIPQGSSFLSINCPLFFLLAILCSCSFSFAIKKQMMKKRWEPLHDYRLPPPCVYLWIDERSVCSLDIKKENLDEITFSFCPKTRSNLSDFQLMPLIFLSSKINANKLAHHVMEWMLIYRRTNDTLVICLHLKDHIVIIIVSSFFFSS